jgi:hypothetical protein
MGKYNTSYAQLSNLILHMSDYNRSKLLDIANKISRDTNYRHSFPEKRKEILTGLFIGFVFGFIFAIFFVASITTIFS